MMNLLANLAQQATSRNEQCKLIFDKVKELPNGAQLSIAIIEKGQVKFCGIKRENDASLWTNNRDRVFEIGSITKVFTATLLANSVLDGQLSLKDSVDAYLDFPLKGEVKLSFEQLATHSSGLPRIPASLDSVSLGNPYKGYGEERFRLYLSEKLMMAHPPGEKFEYSNLGAALLGYVLGKIHRASFEEMLHTQIFSTYQMHNSTTLRGQIEDKLIKGINDAGEVVSNWDMAAFMGAGGILSSVEDLATFALANFDPVHTELELTRKPYFEVNAGFSMGLGWSLIKTGPGVVWNWHNGGTGGYTSSMILDTHSQSGVIILSNVTALGKLTGTITGLAPELMHTLNVK